MSRVYIRGCFSSCVCQQFLLYSQTIEILKTILPILDLTNEEYAPKQKLQTIAIFCSLKSQYFISQLKKLHYINNTSIEKKHKTATT
jgi:hypothetical protein